MEFEIQSKHPLSAFKLKIRDTGNQIVGILLSDNAILGQTFRLLSKEHYYDFLITKKLDSKFYFELEILNQLKSINLHQDFRNQIGLKEIIVRLNLQNLISTEKDKTFSTFFFKGNALEFLEHLKTNWDFDFFTENKKITIYQKTKNCNEGNFDFLSSEDLNLSLRPERESFFNKNNFIKKQITHCLETLKTNIKYEENKNEKNIF